MMSISALLSRLRRTPAPPATPPTREIKGQTFDRVIIDEAIDWNEPDVAYLEIEPQLPAGFVLHPHAEISLPPLGVPVRVDAGDVIGRITSAQISPEGLRMAGYLERALGVPLLDWQKHSLDAFSIFTPRSPKEPPTMPASNAPADVEAWREASGLPARMRSSSTTDAWREDLRRIARETRWGTSAGRLAWAAFMAGAGPSATPWQGFEAGVRFASSYQAGGLEDDAPSAV